MYITSDVEQTLSLNNYIDQYDFVHSFILYAPGKLSHYVCVVVVLCQCVNR